MEDVSRPFMLVVFVLSLSEKARTRPRLVPRDSSSSSLVLPPLPVMVVDEAAVRQDWTPSYLILVQQHPQILSLGCQSRILGA